MPTTADVSRDDSGNLEYRGQKFPGYNKPMKDSGNKQGKVLAKKGNEVKVVRFGDPSMPDNTSSEANDRFYARFGGQAGLSDKFSPLYWSAKWLWPRGKLKGKGAKPFYTLKTSTTKSTTTSLIKAIDDELMQSVEVVYLPDTPDAHGQFASPETLVKACENFNVNLARDSLIKNLYHAKDDDGVAKPTSKYTIMKTWINPEDTVVGNTHVPGGAWLCQLQWLDKSAWDLRKKGVFAGVSFGGQGRVIKPEDRKMNE